MITIISSNNINDTENISDRIMIVREGEVQCHANSSLLLNSKHHDLYC